MKGISGKHCHVLWVPTVCVCLLCVLAVYADLEIFANPPLRPGLNWGAMSNPGLSLERKSDTQPRSSEQAIHIFVSNRLYEAVFRYRIDCKNWDGLLSIGIDKNRGNRVIYIHQSSLRRPWARSNLRGIRVSKRFTTTIHKGVGMEPSIGPKGAPNIGEHFEQAAGL